MDYWRVTHLNVRVGAVLLSQRTPECHHHTTRWHFFPECSNVRESRIWARHLQNNIKCIFSSLQSYEAAVLGHDKPSYEGTGSNAKKVINVEVISHPEFSALGCILCSKQTSTIQSGAIIFTEIPLAFMTEKEICKFISIYQPLALMVISQIHSSAARNEVSTYLLPGHCFALVAKFSSLSSVVKQNILQLCCPLNSFSELVQHSLHRIANLLTSSLAPLTADILFHLLVISSSNVFGDETQSWLGWFQLGCRVNHSCLPNASWTLHTSTSCTMPQLTFTALCDISHGDEITHSYLERERWYPKHHRQGVLLSARGFVCECLECTPSVVDGSNRIAEWDRKRVFTCLECGGCASVVVVTAPGRSRDGQDKMLCVECDRSLCSDECRDMLHKEVLTDAPLSYYHDLMK